MTVLKTHRYTLNEGIVNSLFQFVSRNLDKNRYQDMIKRDALYLSQSPSGSYDVGHVISFIEESAKWMHQESKNLIHQWIHYNLDHLDPVSKIIFKLRGPDPYLAHLPYLLHRWTNFTSLVYQPPLTGNKNNHSWKMETPIQLFDWSTDVIRALISVIYDNSRTLELKDVYDFKKDGGISMTHGKLLLI